QITPIIMENPGNHDITPEEARQLTPLTFTQENWQRLVGDTEPYNPNRVFYGNPGKTTEDGVIFDDVYDENGRKYGGIITGQPKLDQ
ncbi:hypothetical protein KKC94_05555, partial [Patescibacteria group bacterium]|nr:hypothetical protein [Patescibacteria group bacterium]